MTEVSMAASSDGRVRPRVLIEEWLPVTELGIESVRESAPIPGQFPKLKTLHVWWARRPLVASAGAVLTSLLPAWTEIVDRFADAPELKNETAYHEWVLTMCGILGDPVAAQARIRKATDEGVVLGAKAYGYKPAFKNNPTAEDIALLHEVLEHTWGCLPNLTDPTAGGGSIPFEAVRYRVPTMANDLNSVATAILRAGVKIPSKHSIELVNEITRWGKILCNRLIKRLEPFFKLPDLSDNNTYIFARTIICPDTGKSVPLVGDWSLRRASKGKPAVAVKLHTHTHLSARQQRSWMSLSSR